VIIIDLGKLGKAKISEPTLLEILALLVVLVFVAVVIAKR
jgi:hypothetical protein